MTERTQDSPSMRPAPERRRRRLLAWLPLFGFLLLAVFLFAGLYLDARIIPSALLDKPVPQFALPPLAGRDQPGLQTADLQGEISLVNVFASWCVACRVEHPLLMRLAEDGTIPVHGINHKDAPEAALQWLHEWGDPYQRVGVDRDGRASIEWGVYGVPETFLVDAEGRIACKQIGPITERDWERRLRPAIEALRRGERPEC